MRGEDLLATFKLHVHRETPPRAWGRPTVPFVFPTSRGNTPMCVGKTGTLIAPHGLLKKHPHVRGEDRSRSKLILAVSETPPRAWGRPITQQADPRRVRNTPTCVGKTSGRPRLISVRRKHPHVRGEDSRSYSARRSLTETPPRAWGRPKGRRDAVREHRNTPTCVGKTRFEYAGT